jgi:excisionase family DNA binding protein
MKEFSKITLTVDEAVERFGIPKGTLNNLRSARKGPRYYKVGKRILYRVDDFQKWIFSNPVLTTDHIKN